MRSCYKPKLLDFMLNQSKDNESIIKNDTNSPQKKVSSKRCQNNPKNNKKQQRQDDNTLLDVSQYRSKKINKQHFVSVDQTYDSRNKSKLSKNIPIVSRLKTEQQQNKISILSSKIKQLQKQLESTKSQLKQFKTKTSNLEVSLKKSQQINQSLQKQLRKNKLQSNYFSLGDNGQSKVNKIQTSLRKEIEQFIENLKHQKISLVVERIIEVFLEKLLEINGVQSVKNTQANNNKHNLSIDNTPLNKIKIENERSRDQSPIAKQSNIKKDKFLNYTPYQQIQNSQRKNKSKSINTYEFKQNLVSSQVPKFSYVKQSVDPCITQESAFMSVSCMDYSTNKGGADLRSRSQKRRKIFQ